MNNLVCLIRYVMRVMPRSAKCRLCTLPVTGYHPDGTNPQKDGRVEFWLHNGSYNTRNIDDADNMCCLYKVENGLITSWHIGDSNKAYERKIKPYE